MCSNTSTNCIAHLRRIHGVSKDKDTQQTHISKKRKIDSMQFSSTPTNVPGTPESLDRMSPLEASVKAGSIGLYSADGPEFSPPPGYILDPNVRPPGCNRSNIYDYGHRCISVSSMELRWFCCANETCRANSAAGLKGISMKGYFYDYA